MAPIPKIPDSTLESICQVLGDTSAGLTGSEIGRLLRECGIVDPDPSNTKRLRLYEALRLRQSQDGCANNVIAVIKAAMAPVRYHQNPESFASRRAALNRVFAFCGLSLKEDGELVQSSAVRTLTEAEERATDLRTELVRRSVNPDVLAFCRAELLQQNYFHAVFEATKSVAEKIRALVASDLDGSELVDFAFGFGSEPLPRAAFNSLTTQTERSEHTGLANLMKGLFGTFRNTTAHAPRTTWPIDKADALDMLSLASLLHRRLDRAVRTGRV